MASKRSFVSFSASFTGLIETVCILALAGTWLASLGSLHWLLDLFSHFRLEYLVLCLLVLVFAVWQRRKLLGLIAVVSLFWNAWPVFEVHRTGEAGEGKLTLMTFNVFYKHKEPERVIEHVMNADPDVVCLLETDWRWHEHLQPLRDKYPHHTEELEYGAFGFACFTRLPTKPNPHLPRSTSSLILLHVTPTSVLQFAELIELGLMLQNLFDDVASLLERLQVSVARGEGGRGEKGPCIIEYAFIGA